MDFLQKSLSNIVRRPRCCVINRSDGLLTVCTYYYNFTYHHRNLVATLSLMALNGSFGCWPCYEETM